MNKFRITILALLSALVFVLFSVSIASAAITAAALTADAGSTTNVASYATASITPTANNLVLAWVTNTKAGTPDTPTLSGNGLTWVQVATVTWGTIAAPTNRTTLFRAMGAAPTAGAVTIDFAAVNQTGCAWSIVQFSGVDTSGTNGSGAVVQSVTGRTDNASAAAGLSITLAALGNANNASAGGFSNVVNLATSISSGAGYTASAGATYATPSVSIRSEWKTTGSTTVNVTQSAISNIGGIAVEVKADLCPGNVVTTTADTGMSSLRECINKANVFAGTTIGFNIATAANQSSGGDSWWRINPASALPTITGAGTVIDGTTQTTNRGNTNSLGPEIEINGGSVANAHGLNITSANNTIKSLAINGFSSTNYAGINITGASATGNTVKGCYLGVNAIGTASTTGYTGLLNNYYGILVQSGAQSNVIGGTLAVASDRNVISNNKNGTNIGAGVYISGAGTSNNVVKGNYIGPDATGNGAIANSNISTGIYITSNASNNTIGSSTAGEGNVISGNANSGIWIDGAATGNTIKGNYIGVKADGSGALANGLMGILIDGSSANASSNTIGGTGANDKNIISGNAGTGGIVIQGASAATNVVYGNYIGTNPAGTAGIANTADGIVINTGAHNNTVGGTAAGQANVIAYNGKAGVFLDGAATDGNIISGNSIYSNTQIGIDIAGAASARGVGTGIGANNNKARPTITALTANGANFDITATVTSGDTVEFFRVNNAAAPVVTADGTGSGEGYLYLGKCIDNGACSGPYISGVTDASGVAGTVKITITAAGVVSGDYVTAIATDATNGTSEFAANSQALSLCAGGVVTTVADTGIGSLRECINYANASPGTTISFNIATAANQSSGGDSWWRISPASALPTITAANTFIDGATQTTNQGNTNTLGPEIEINGAGAGSVHGLTVASTNITIKGLVINGFSASNTAAIYVIAGASSPTIQGNYIGTNATGTAAIANDIGLYINGNPSNALIGGATLGQGNLLSGNTQSGIFDNAASGSTIQGNTIGLNAAGTAKIGNGNGIAMMHSVNTTIGGAAANAGNIISGNGWGIFQNGGSTNNLVIKGNKIGTGPLGSETTLNNTVNGIDISNGSNITIGGLASGESNLIAYNSNGINAGVATSFTIKGNIFRGQKNSAVNVIGSGIEITGNLMVNNGVTNTLDGVRIFSGSTGNKIYHNTIHGSGRDGIRVEAASNVIRNNIISNSAGYGLNNVGAVAVTQSHNIYYSNTSGASNATLDASEVVVNPLYTNAAGGDFTLQNSSPAINRGVDLVADQPDMNGASAGNYNGYAPDMGYWESAVTTTCPVSSTADSGAGTLRACITYANTAPGTTVSFSISVADSGYQTSGTDHWWRISPASALPSIIAAGTIIDGSTQTTNQGNTNSKGPEIEIYGGNSISVGLDISAGSNITIQNVVVNSFTSTGIAVGGATVSQTHLYGNYVGTNATGTAAMGNGTGVYCWNGNQTSIDIGGSGAGQGNLISGNTQYGISLAGGSTYRIYGNKIGVDRTGTAELANGNAGIDTQGTTSSVTIGGSSAGQGNIIAKNTLNGIALRGTTSSVTIMGNTIGSGITGTESNLGNGLSGIWVITTHATPNVVIGGLSSGEGNLIAYNSRNGIRSEFSNGTGYQILGNTIRNNTWEGVYNAWDNVTISGNAIYSNGSGVTKYDGINVDTAADNTKVYHNTVHGNGKNGILIAGTNATVKNNSITGNGSAAGHYGLNVTGSLTSEAYNLITNASTTPANFSGQSNVALAATDLSANPLYTNAGAGDFTLQNSSPAINRGVDLAADQPDMNGASAGNYNGYAPDMGYWESAVTTTCPVSSTADSGAGTLRACITYANTTPGTTVSFSISTVDTGYQTSGADHWWRIAPVSTLPSITAANTVIDGTTQATTIGDANSKGPEIEINGAGAGAGVNGLTINNVANVTLKGLVINGFAQDGINISGSSASGHTIQKNYIGTNASGSAASANSRYGIYLLGTATNTGPNNIDIGGANAGEGNVISGNTSAGIRNELAYNVRIRGNKIGVDQGGTAKIANANGIYLTGAAGKLSSSITIGGSSTPEQNIISGNTTFGILVEYSASVIIMGNNIGVGSIGTETTLGNGTGIFTRSASTNVTIGGLTSGMGNVIARNPSSGIFAESTTGAGLVVQGNTVRNNGTYGIMANSTGMLLTNNLIYSNTGNGIRTLVNNVKIYHNIVHGNTIGISVEVNSGTVRNNVITGNSNVGLNIAGAGVTEDHNLVTDASTNPGNGGGRSNVALAISDRNLDPKYINAAGGNFSLTECSSPAINAGADLGVDQPDMNGAGAGNWTGILPDMGALESSCSGANDIALDGNFGDWDNGSGNEFCMSDQAGVDDWTSPAKLDITKYCIGSNLSDRFFVLFGFDDTSFASDATACVLLDTDSPADNYINKVFCVTVNGTAVQSLTLYNCDNSIAGGCGSAAVSKTYNPADYAIGTAAGPFGGSDTFVEAQLPYADIGVALGNIVFTSMITYPGAAFLKSPKDSIFGTGGKQNYNDRVQYDTAGIGAIQGNPLIPSVSGNVYTDEGATPIGAGKSVHLLRNGVDGGTNTTDAGGGYYIQNASLAAGDAALAYIDNDATYKGTTVSVFNSSNITGFDIYAGRVITRQDNAGVLSNATMGTAKGASADTDIEYSVAAGALAVSGTATLYVPAGHSYTPGNTITVPAMKSLGTFNGGSFNDTINGAFTVAGGAYTASSGTTSVSGALSLTGGTFSHNNGAVILNGTGQSITGSFTFNNLTKSVASADTLTFAAGSTTTVNGTCTLNGASGQRLSLRSTSSPTKWNLTLGASATKAITYVDVKDSDASGSNAAKKPITPTNSISSGNNISWFPFLPDLMIRLATETDGDYLTDNSYESSASVQVKSAGVVSGSAATYYLKIQNDNDETDSIVVTGTATGSNFTVQYLDDTATDRTAAVTGAGYTIANLAGGGSKVWTVNVTPNGGGTPVAGGTSYNVLFTATSGGDATKTDQVKATTTSTSANLTLLKSADRANVNPGQEIAYTVTASNGAGLTNASGIVLRDPIPANTGFKVGGASFDAGSSTLTATPGYSSDNGATWTYTPVSGGCSAPAGYDHCVTDVRWSMTGAMPTGTSFNVGLVVRVK